MKTTTKNCRKSITVTLNNPNKSQQERNNEAHSMQKK